MSYTQVFGGTTLYPSDVSYLAVTLNADKMLEWPLESNDPANPAARIIDVTTSGSHSIILPDAVMTGAGQTLLLNNLPGSTNSFTLKNYAGVTIATVGIGEQWQVYLADTSTAGGVWRVFRYGASTATVQASALAGYGLTVTSGTLSQSTPVTTFNTSPRTALTTDRASMLVWTGSGAGTLNLPTAASVGNNYLVSARNSGGGDLTIDPAGSETVDGAPTLVLRPGDSVTLTTDGLTWYSLGLGQEAVFAFDYTSITVTGGNYTLSGSELNRIAYEFVGTLTSDCYVIVPSTIQQYWISNATTGPFVLYFKTSTGTPVAVTQGARGIYYCNGSNVVDADTSTVSLPVSVANGGTGITSYTTGDILYANSASTLSKLADVAVGNVLLSGGVGVAPAYGKVSLTQHISGVLPVANGGTGAPDAPTALVNLGATTVGGNFFSLINPAAITFPRINADNTVSALSASTFRTAIGAGTGNGTVTSVGGTGSVNGLTLTGTVTTSGNLTLGGTLTGVDLTTAVTGTLPVGSGGTGQTTYTNGQLLIGNTTGNTLTKATLTAGTGISITNGTGSITIAATGGTGTVTSVSGAGTVNGLTLTGTVTTSGSLTLGGTLTGVSLTTAVTGILPVANGGTGGGTQAAGRTGLGATTVGSNLFTLTDPGVTAFIQLNADSSVSLLSASGFRTAIGAGTGNGTVTSVGGTGTVNGLTLSGTVTTSGNLTLGGSVTSVASGATIDGVTIGYRNIPQSTNTTAAASDVGKHIYTNAGVTINASIFSAGDAFVIANSGSTSMTITQGTNVTLRLAGTATTGNRTLAGYGEMNVLCVVGGANPVFVVSGAGLS